MAETATVSATTDTKTLPQPDLDRLIADRGQMASDAARREEELGKSVATTVAAEAKEREPVQQQLDTERQSLSQLKLPEPTADQIKWQPKPIVDPKDFQAFSWAMLGMAMIGGAASRGNWLGVSSSLNGAMQGYLDGSKARADKAYQDYQTQFKAALEHDSRAQREFENVLQSKTLSINAMLGELQNIAAKYNRQDILLAASQRSIDAVWRQVEATDRAIAQLEEYHDRTGVTLRLGLDRLKQQGGATGDLNDYGRWFVEQNMQQGNMKFAQMLQSRFGGAVAARAFNDIGQQLQQSGIDPRSITENQLNNQVQFSIQRQVGHRKAAVERLTGTLQRIEQELQALVTKVNGQGVRAVNKTLNDIASQFGDTDVAELRTLMLAAGREYMEAVVMPGSNAQMHASAQDAADRLADPNANVATLQGVLKGMNFDIAASRHELEEQINQSKQAVIGQGVTLSPPGGTVSPAPPVSGVSGGASPLNVPPGPTIGRTPGVTGIAPPIESLLDKYAPQGAPRGGGSSAP